MSEGRDCVGCGHHIIDCRCDEVKINRSSETGQFITEQEAKENPNETTTESVETRSSWMKEWIRLGQDIEIRSKDDLTRDMDELAVAAVLHAQALKRPE